MEQIDPTPNERHRRDDVMDRVLGFVRRDEKIKLPPFDPLRAVPSAQFALQSIEENDFSGSLGPFKYQLEGEDDLLHLIVLRGDGGTLTPQEARLVASFVFKGVPPAVIWLKPGEFSQHFYVGHDELLRA